MRKSTKSEARLREVAPGMELESILMEATASVENDLRLEDAGWENLSGRTGEVIDDANRIVNLKLSRLYYLKDPMAKQAVRLWTDYTFGTGMTWSVAEENKDTQTVLDKFWNSKANQSTLSARGQRRSCDKGLVDGEVFFAIFLGPNGTSKLRTIDPLEITEIITDPDDKDTELYYKRSWSDAQGQVHTTIYRSTINQKANPAKDFSGADVTQNDEALVYHLTFNTISQRGNPLLLPALDWIKQYRRFMASRIAIMLALARFAWKSKVKGGSAAVASIKAKTDDKTPDAGSHLIENLGVETTPIKTESGASGAYQDGKMIKYQICAAVGIPEQYFGDISTGNLATAKTVELPMMKMFQSYQRVWADTYKDINEVVLEAAGIAPDKWYVDMDFPVIAPEDVALAAQAISQLLMALPDLAYADDVKQLALMTMGVNDPAQVLQDISNVEESDPNVTLLKGLRRLRESLDKKE